MSLRNCLFAFLSILVLGSCKSIKPESPPIPSLPDPPPAISDINIPLDIPLDLIENRLNTATNSRLFQDGDLQLGSGLTADVTVDRTGPIGLQASDQSRLKASIPLHLAGTLRFEKKVFGQVLSTKIPFDERLAPQFSFDPGINPDWTLQVNQLEVDNWGRSLRFNLLGFEIDLEPLLQRQVQRVLNNQLQVANLRQLDIKKTAETTWELFSDSYGLEVMGIPAYIATQPIGVRFQQELGQDQVLRLYIGMQGKIWAGIGETPVIEKRPLPALVSNEQKENKIALEIPLVVPFNELDSYLNGEFSGKALRLDSKTTLVPSNIQTRRYGDQTLLFMDFVANRKDKKEISGQMYFAGAVAYNKDEQRLELVKPQFDVKSDDFFSNLAMWMKRGKIERQMRKIASFPIGGILADAPEVLTGMMDWDLGFAFVAIEGAKLDVLGIYQTERDIQVYLQGTGSVRIDTKD